MTALARVGSRRPATPVTMRANTGLSRHLTPDDGARQGGVPPSSDASDDACQYGTWPSPNAPNGRDASGGRSGAEPGGRVTHPTQRSFRPKRRLDGINGPSHEKTA